MNTRLYRRSALPFGVVAAVAATGIGLFTSLYMGAASLAYFLMILGLGYRRGNRILHRRLMFSAMSIDLLVVLTLEIQRSAVETVIALDLTPLQFSHVLASTLALTLYLPMIILGNMLWSAELPVWRRWHKRIGVTAFVLRTIGFVLMFSLLSRYS